MALDQTQDRTPNLIVMHGLSGSGKTWVSSQLMSAMSAIRIRSDIERKRLHGLDETSNSGSGIAQGIYTRAANKSLYGQIHDLAALILRAGHDVILDASYLKLSERDCARQIAAECGAGIVLVHAHAPVNILRDRIQTRADSVTEASEANLAVLEYQLENIEMLTPQEQRAAVRWSDSEDTGIPDLVRKLAERQASPPDLSSLAS